MRWRKCFTLNENRKYSQCVHVTMFGINRVNILKNHKFTVFKVSDLSLVDLRALNIHVGIRNACTRTKEDAKFLVRDKQI